RLGFAKKSQLVRNRASSVRDVFILCGGKTGRDGIHGVTYASVDLTDRSVREWEAGAVELGDPILKEPLIHACIESAKAGLLDGMKDLGGGGLSCVVGEMSLAGGFGAEVDLDRVPLKEEGLAPWEIWVSESQERMMLAVLPEYVQKVLRIFELYDVPATVIGRAIPEKICRVRHRKTTVLEMDLEFYTGGPEYTREYRPPRTAAAKDLKLPPEPRDYRTAILRLLAAPNIASKEYVIRQYDHEVRASTVIKPLQGGIGTTAKALGLPIPSGNVSFYNESPLGPCPPTPVVLGVGIVEDLRACVTTDFKRSGDPVVLVGTTQAELGGSEYFRLRKKGQG